MEDDNVALQSTSAAFEDDNDQLRMITVMVSLSQDDNEDDNAELTVTVSDREDDNEDDNCAACRVIATPPGRGTSVLPLPVVASRFTILFT